MHHEGAVEEGLGGGGSGYEANLSPAETGLPFTVFMRPHRATQHGARVMVTSPPWGVYPEAFYRVQPFEFVSGKDWLTADQTALLWAWVELNERVLEDFCAGRILFRDFSAKVVVLGGASPADYRAAVAALRVIVPKVRAIHWRDGQYWLTLKRLPLNPEKITYRFGTQGFSQPIVIDVEEPSGAVLLWRATQKYRPDARNTPMPHGDEAFRRAYAAVAAMIAAREAREVAPREPPERGNDDSLSLPPRDRG